MPDRRRQIVQAHGALIVAVVQAGQNPASRPDMDNILQTSAANGWTDLVAVIRKILQGNRDTALLQGLDEEDHAIIDAILKGLQNPAGLPTPGSEGEAGAAAPGLASIVHAASHGDADALRWVGEMSEQMQHSGGSMARVGASLGQMMHGERNVDKLCQGMDAAGEKLVQDILAELAKLQTP